MCLFQEEARHWRDELHWDYRPSIDLIRKFIDSRALGGYVAIENGQPAGYGFYVLEDHKGLIGGLVRFLAIRAGPGHRRAARPKCWRRCEPRRGCNGSKRS